MAKRHPSIQAIIDQCRAKGLHEAASYIVELEGAVAYTQRRADAWRGIASAMGYEPLAHTSVQPTAPWLLARIAKFRAAIATPTNAKSGGQP